MGLRFRKSVNFGPLRINLSKSGVGYSVGGKGFRYTKKANGGTRNTIFIPGTGISYVKEYGAKKKSACVDTQGASNSKITEDTFITTALDADVLRSLNEAAFEEYVQGYINYAKTLTNSDDSDVLDAARAQVNLINSEIDRRALLLKNKNSNSSFERLIAGSVLALGGAGTLFFSWLGALPLLAGIVLLCVEYTK